MKLPNGFEVLNMEKLEKEFGRPKVSENDAKKLKRDDVESYRYGTLMIDRYLCNDKKGFHLFKPAGMTSVFDLLFNHGEVQRLTSVTKIDNYYTEVKIFEDDVFTWGLVIDGWYKVYLPRYIYSPLKHEVNHEMIGICHYNLHNTQDGGAVRMLSYIQHKMRKRPTVLITKLSDIIELMLEVFEVQSLLFSDYMYKRFKTLLDVIKQTEIRMPLHEWTFETYAIFCNMFWCTIARCDIKMLIHKDEKYFPAPLAISLAYNVCWWVMHASCCNLANFYYKNISHHRYDIEGKQIVPVYAIHHEQFGWEFMTEISSVCEIMYSISKDANYEDAYINFRLFKYIVEEKGMISYKTYICNLFDDKKNEMYDHYTKHGMKLKPFTIALGWFVFADVFIDLLEDAKKH